MTHKLDLLGKHQLETLQGVFVLERKTAAVLAYVALEGPTPKYKLAGMLWPESSEATARNNMRQLLRRLRLGGGEILTGTDCISLRADVEVDVRQLSLLTTYALEVLRNNAELLVGLEYDDAPDFEAWLDCTRQELLELRARNAELEATRLQHLGNFRNALDYASVRLSIDRLSEAAYRQVAQLHFLLGDRAAALATLQRCRNVVADELGAELSPMTEELFSSLQRGVRSPSVSQRSIVTELPASILRPPLLVGRELAWEQLEAAWQARQILMVTGEPGIGKTRLVEEFARSKGETFRIDGRPGDTNVPYASQARALRSLLKRKPELDPRSGHLEGWVWQELSRLLPELGSPAHPAQLVVQAEGRLRFYDAISLTMAYCTRDLQTVIVDDLQFYDDYTMEVAAYYQSQAYAQTPEMPPHITVFRKGELSDDKQAIVDQFAESGVSALIDLDPLSDRAIGSLLDSLDLPESSHLVSGLSRYTGGNPLFILETVKHLIETGTLARELPSRLAPPGKIGALVTRRLKKLSPGALNLARTAAIAGTAFDLRLAESVLARPPLEIAVNHEELEAAQVLRGNGFSHDLVLEAVRSSLPNALSIILSCRTAGYLETLGADHAVIAAHWLSGGEQMRAVPHLLQAADVLDKRFHAEEADRLREQATHIHAHYGTTDTVNS